MGRVPDIIRDHWEAFAAGFLFFPSLLWGWF